MNQTDKNEVEQCIEILAYFTIFRHPLTILEFEELADRKNSQSALNELITKEVIQIVDGYILVNGLTNVADIENRKSFEKNCLKQHHQVLRNSKLISKFPFVRGIGISGSVSKGIMKDDGDIDFFIITANNRLWVSRTFLILYKKLFRLNSRKFFCLNYFISESRLEIPDQNIFTATEIIFLSPTFGKEVFKSFKSSNSWVNENFPNRKNPINFGMIPQRKYFLKRTLEKILNGKLGEKLDQRFMRITHKRWQKKFPNFTDKEMELAMRSNRNVSKHHPNNFQTKVLKELDKRIEQLKKKL